MTFSLYSQRWVQSSRKEPSSPTRAPGTSQLLLTNFFWVLVCIKKTAQTIKVCTGVNKYDSSIK